MCASTAAFAPPVAALRLLRRQNGLHTSPPRRARASAPAACAPPPAASPASDWQGLQHEIEQARRERRPYRIDKARLTQQERHILRLRSKAIPLVADRAPLTVVHEDEHVLVVAKPPFLKMHPAHRFHGGTLLNRAIGYLGYAPRIVHRLDMHTTGVVVLAKRKDACVALMRQFAHSAVQKDYLCVVDNAPFHPVATTLRVDAPVGRSRLAPFMRAVADTSCEFARAKHAFTSFEVLAKASGGSGMALLRASPRTGRTHQIRVHAAFRGHPIVGDDLYNPTERAMYADFDEVSAAAHDRDLQRFGDGNPLRRDLMLHAWRITLVHPATEQPVTYCAPPPPHMRGLLAATGMSVPSP